MSSEGRERLVRLARQVADGATVDWEAERAANPSLSVEIDNLRTIESIAEAGRTTVSAAGDEGTAGRARTRMLFSWGPLEVLERVGAGGFGEVYRALDPRLDREVALKLRAVGSEAEAQSARRFLEEARRLARVRHPNVVTVYGADIHEGRVGLWMDFVGGRTLEARLAEEGALGAEEAVLIGLDLCRALAAVHAAGLIHGDLKLSNVMREQGGRILLMDFGAAHEHLADQTGGSRAVFGTPLFAAPEVLRGAAAGRSSDLYSLGVLLYRLVSKRYPVAGASVAEVVEKHTRGERTPLRDVRSDLPVAFVQVVERALAPDPTARYPSAGALETALAGCLRTLDTSRAHQETTPTPRRVRNRATTLLGGAVLITALALGILGAPQIRKAMRGGAHESSIAVLPLANIETGDAEYLTQGISQAVITRLTQTGLRVTPWVTARRYAGTTKPLGEIARELGVGAVLVGEFQLLGEGMQTTLSLVDARSGLQTWAEEFWEPSRDLFRVQQQIATAVALRLKGQLSGAEREVLAVAESHSLDAYDFCLQGAHILQEGNEEAAAVASRYFEKALELDPRLAEAHVGLGAVHTSQYFFGWGEGPGGLERAEDHYRTALDLSPNPTPARRGLIRIDWERGDSEACVDRAHQAGATPAGGAEALLARAEGYTLGGLPDLAVPLLDRVFELDPANEAAHWFMTLARAWSGDYPGAIEAGAIYLHRFADDVEIHTWMAMCHQALGDLDAAQAAYAQAMRMEVGDDLAMQLFTGANLRTLLLAGFLHDQLGERDLAEGVWAAGVELVRPRLASFPDNVRLRLFRAAYLAALGRVDEAAREEERALALGLNALEIYFLAATYATVGEDERASRLLLGAVRDGRLYAPWRLLFGVIGAPLLETGDFERFRHAYETLEQELRKRYS